jgi:uncharacterized membrane protein YjgN (DUF898 family)
MVDTGSGASAASSSAARAVTQHTPEFRGDGAEYFRIWIVNLALTVVTLGIYSAWAKVRKLRYFYSSTSLAGSAFGYHGEPLAILKGRLIAIALAVVYYGATQYSPLAGALVAVLFALALPWLLVRSRMFAMRMTSWRGLRFSFREDYAGAYKVLLGWGLAAILSLGILIPYFLRERYRFVITRSAFGSEPFECEPSVGRFYKTALAAIGLALVVGLVVVAIVYGVIRAQGATIVNSPSMAVVTMAVTVVAYLLIFVVVGAYVQARNLNEVFGTTSIGPHRLQSSLQARRLTWLYLTNVLAIILTLGLYIPWAQVRVARYRLETLALEVHGSLDEFVASATPAPSATGEEISELFDVQVGL